MLAAAAAVGPSCEKKKQRPGPQVCLQPELPYCVEHPEIAYFHGQTTQLDEQTERTLAEHAREAARFGTQLVLSGGALSNRAVPAALELIAPRIQVVRQALIAGGLRAEDIEVLPRDTDQAVPPEVFAKRPSLRKEIVPGSGYVAIGCLY